MTHAIVATVQRWCLVGILTREMMDRHKSRDGVELSEAHEPFDPHAEKCPTITPALANPRSGLIFSLAGTRNQKFGIMACTGLQFGANPTDWL